MRIRTGPEQEEHLKVSSWKRVVALAATLGIAAGAAWAEGPESDTLVTEPSAKELSDRIEGMNEQVLTLQSDMDKLKRFKFSGYLQARWETGEAQSDTVKTVGNPLVLTPANNERFYIRRGRLKLTYDASPHSQAVVYFDGATDRTVRLLEAYVTLLDPWTPEKRHQLTIGQMNVPFGYELERSSSTRELPERSRAENVLFSGERDRGVKFVSQWTTKLETVVGVYNGGGVNQPDFPNTDPTRRKDVVARARWAQGVFDAAVSYYDGKNTIPLTGDDLQADKTRLGVDAQAYYELPVLGGGSLRGEFYRGQDTNADSVRTLIGFVATTTPRDVTKDARLLKAGAEPEHLSTDFVGGYLMWVQNLGESFQLAARYDRFDPNSDLDHDQYQRTGIGVNGFYGGNVRVTLSYDVIKTEVAQGGGRFTDPKDNLWTVQFQHKF